MRFANCRKLVGACRNCVVLASIFLMAISARAAVVISSAQTQNMNCSNGLCVPTAASAILNVNDLLTLLAAGSTEVMTTGANGVQANDIVVSAAFSWSNGYSLTLDAYHSLTVEQAIVVDGTSPISLVTNDGGEDGTLSFISGGQMSFAGIGNMLTVNGHAYKLASDLLTLASDISR